MYNAGTGTAAAAAAGGTLAFTGVQNIWLTSLLGVLFLLIGAGAVAHGFYRNRKEAKSAGM